MYKENLELHQKQRAHVVAVMQRRARELFNKQKDLTIQYKKLQEAWSKKVRLLDEAKPFGKNKKRGPPRGV